MGSSPKSLRSKGRLSNAGSPPKAQRRISLALLWMAAALAVVGLFHLETMYAMTGLHAWKRSASGAKDGSGSDGEPAASSVIPPTALLLATHTRLLWYDPLTDTSQILHEGEGVHYGMFPGEGKHPTTVWTAIRPHNWRPTTTKEHLVEFDMRTGAELRRLEIPSRFTHDVVRAGDKVYVCDTGNGQILEYYFPAMQLERTMPLFTLKDHVNTLAPLRPNETLAILHNLGTSDIVRVDTTKEPAQIIARIQRVGKKAHGLVKWHGSYLLLDSDNGALAILRIQNGKASVNHLWKAPEPNRFLKGLAVVDDIAYFGVSEWAPRDARDDPRSNNELAAFDLMHDRLLWRRQVPTAGLLNIVGAPHISEDSTYRAVYSPSPIKSFKTPHSPAVVEAAVKSQEALGYPPRVGGYWSSGMPYLDASVKATPFPWVGGLQLPLMHFDVSKAKAFLENLPPEVWTHEWQAVHSAVMGGRSTNQNSFKPGVQGITLLFSAGSGEGAVYEFPLYKHFAPLLNPMIEEIIGTPDMVNIIRMQLALMRPNVSDIKIHVDTGGYATYAHRLHIPLMTNKGVSFDLCPYTDDAKTQQVCYKVPTGEGFIFELNNKVPHRVSNNGTTDRVHLVFDVAETPRQRVILSPGAECDYDVNVGMFCTGAEDPHHEAQLRQQHQQYHLMQQQAAVADAGAAGAAGAAAPARAEVERPAIEQDDPRLAGMGGRGQAASMQLPQEHVQLPQQQQDLLASLQMQNLGLVHGGLASQMQAKK